MGGARRKPVGETHSLLPTWVVGVRVRLRVRVSARSLNHCPVRVIRSLLASMHLTRRPLK